MLFQKWDAFHFKVKSILLETGTSVFNVVANIKVKLSFGSQFRYWKTFLSMLEIIWVCESTWTLNFMKSKHRSSISSETSLDSLKYTPVC